MDYIYLISLGLATGLASSYFGIGGATIIIPALYFIFPQLSATTVIGSGLCVIFLNSIVNTYNFQKANVKLNFKIIFPMLPSLALMTLVGAQIALHTPDLWLKRIFSIVLFIVILKVLFLKVSRDDAIDSKVPKNLVGFIFGGIIGFITGITGLGGGVILTPAFLVFYKMRPKLIPAYNNLIMILSSLTGILKFSSASTQDSIESLKFPDFQIGQTNWAIALLVLSGAVVTSKLGVYLNNKTADKHKNYLFALLLLILSVRVLLSTL